MTGINLAGALTYYRLAMTMPVDWLEECAADPSPFMGALHVRLIRLAIRRKQA